MKGDVVFVALKDELMDGTLKIVGSVLDEEENVDEGFADNAGGVVDAKTLCGGDPVVPNGVD